MGNTKIITLENLYLTDFELTDIYAMRQKWIEGVTYTRDRPRQSSGLIYLNGCSGVYTDRHGESFEAPQKSLVYLPYGSEYSVLNKTCGKAEPDAYLVEFNMKVGEEYIALSESPFMIRNDNIYIVKEYEEKVVAAYEAPVRSPVTLRALIYEMISALGRGAHMKYDKKYMSIAPGIRILEENALVPYTVEELAEFCGISSGCFRRLFREYSGKSPVSYRTDLKINMAKNLLESGDMSLDAISESLGFESTSYFCRVFKKNTGFTPSKYREELHKK